MTDSADIGPASISEAAKRLAAAVGALEGALDPLLARHTALQTEARESQGFAEDRTRLAAQLDEALEARRVREAEFGTLSRQTRQELDGAISALQGALSNGLGGDAGGPSGG